MAIGRPGIVGDVSGRLGGVEVALSKGRLIVKQAKVVRSRVSGRTYAAQGTQAAGIRHWESLTDAQRQSWETVAQQKPVPDRFGIPRQRTARELFLTVPHDHRFGVPENWQDLPPTKSIRWVVEPEIVVLTTTDFRTGSIASAPASQWVASAWFARFTKPYIRQHRGWFKGGLDPFNQATQEAEFASSMAALKVKFVSGEHVAIMVQYWREGYWPTWWDFGVQTIP